LRGQGLLGQAQNFVVIRLSKFTLDLGVRDDRLCPHQV